MWAMQSQSVWERSLEGGWTGRCSHYRAGTCCMNIVSSIILITLMMIVRMMTIMIMLIIIVIMMMMIMMIIMMILIMIIMIVIKRFPAHDELGTCRTSLVSPEQPVSCIPVRKHDLAINSGIKD